ncbi:MAG: hypothetical protein KJ057_16415 [Phycisphaerae bacterium]|nr:MAG: hypothetical protein F9K17_11475 [Phycisphaerae bacterium]MBE7455199.1 hypothetical protein [Planctomycetia bacterium]MCK6466315.1 hypothetical protein [Phycisphaerae bacterium]MCL4720053.1 hypothetical protein [Phycisphaerae bacterium]NUQ10337.1 hypothetical protein [Phycisphaerae bacterium]
MLREALLLGACVGTAQAQKPDNESFLTNRPIEGNRPDESLVIVDGGVPAAPIAVALMDEEGVLPDTWQPWPDVRPVELCGAFLCFDAFEMDSTTDAPGDGFYGQNCGLGSGRYRFADNTRNVVFVDDLDRMNGAAVGACNSAEFGRVQFAWWWQVSGPGSSERCVIGFSTFEDWENSGNCTSAGFVSGIAVDFGILPSSHDTGGYYFVDLPLCLLPGNLKLTAPADGRGAYKIVLAKDVAMTPATLAQPMLWGTQKPLNECNQMRRMHWDQNHNGQVNGGECQALDIGQCMNPLGAMTAFWYRGSPATPKLRAHCEERGRLTARVKGYPRGERVQLKYDGGNNNPLIANNRGKGKVVWRDVPPGSHTVQASSDATFSIYRNTSCPPR